MYLPFGIIVALAVVIIDQVSKYWLLYNYMLPKRDPVEITPFFNLVEVWNPGISFGMLTQFGLDNKTALIAIACGLIVMLVSWLNKVKHPFLARAIGLIIGGAVGNIIDRARLGAVFDFIDIHAYGYHWPAFNIADAAISIGVILIIFDSIYLCNKSETKKTR